MSFELTSGGSLDVQYNIGSGPTEFSGSSPISANVASWESQSVYVYDYQISTSTTNCHPHPSSCRLALVKHIMRRPFSPFLAVLMQTQTFEDFSQAEKESAKDGLAHGVAAGLIIPVGFLLATSVMPVTLYLYPTLFVLANLIYALMVRRQSQGRFRIIGFLKGSMLVFAIILVIGLLLLIAGAFVAGTGGQ